GTEHIIHMCLKLSEFVILNVRKVNPFTYVLAKLNLIHLGHQFFQGDWQITIKGPNTQPK
ncbi:MAG: hypothetical protein ACI88A_005302, partial [Paraglaciecola sp.]